MTDNKSKSSCWNICCITLETMFACPQSSVFPLSLSSGMQTSGIFSPVLLLPTLFRLTVIFPWLTSMGRDEPLASSEVTQLSNSHITSGLAANQRVGHMTSPSVAAAGGQTEGNIISFCSLWSPKLKGTTGNFSAFWWFEWAHY